MIMFTGTLVPSLEVANSRTTFASSRLTGDCETNAVCSVRPVFALNRYRADGATYEPLANRTSSPSREVKPPTDETASCFGAGNDLP